jgi:hypothetical protein
MLPQLLAEQSRYLDLIRHDLQPWKDTGITKVRSWLAEAQLIG